ncbi:MAG: ABC transporter ATP-binding protein [Clostridiales bacterium]|jgi:ABC-type lipoprotein export system ATPase subunit|nr:ABC transporter ATP-binding protein [Clostridiales bacterium]
MSVKIKTEKKPKKSMISHFIADMPDNAIIYCENLVKTYQAGGVDVKALQGLDLVVNRGEMIAIIGNSGSGKSTLMNIIGGLDKPTSGKIYVNNRDMLTLNQAETMDYMRKCVGFVWQNTARNMIPYLTAIDNVKLIMQIAGKLDNNRAHMLIEMVGLEHRKNNKMAELSGGEQQRVAIAIGLANNPSILLADEPTGAVDTKTTAHILKIFNDLNSDLGVTVLIVTHDRQLSHLVHRVVSISDGRIGSEFIRRTVVDMSKEEETLDATSGHDTGSHEEFGLIDGKKRLFIPDKYLNAIGVKERSKVKITLEDDSIVLRNPERVQEQKEADKK